MTRVATGASNELLLHHVMEIQKRLQETHRQVTTERRYNDYQGLGLEANRAINFENELRTAERFIQNNNLADARLDATSTALEAMRETISDFRSRLKTYAMGDPRQEQETRDIQQFAFQAMKDLESYLNVQFNGDFLFAGGRTSEQPVTIDYATLEDFQAAFDGTNADNATDPDPLNPALAFDPAAEFPNWLHDDGLELKHRVDIDQQVQIGVPASRAAFKDALEAMATIAQGDLTNFGSAGGLESNLDTRVPAALDKLESALEDLTAIEHSMANSRRVIHEKNDKHETYGNFLKDRLADLQQVDTTEAVARLMDDSRALEVSYNALSRVRQMSLVNYI